MRDRYSHLHAARHLGDRVTTFVHGYEHRAHVYWEHTIRIFEFHRSSRGNADAVMSERAGCR